MTHLKSQQRPGAVAMLTILGIMSVVMIVMISVSSAATGNFQSTRSATSSQATFAAAEGGIQQALYGLKQDMNYVPTNPINVGDIPIPVTVVIDRASSPRTITATATGPTGIVRTLKSNFHLSSFGGVGGALIAGTGTFSLGNNDTIIGDICSNSSIMSSNGVTINGNVDIAGSGHEINNATITGSVRVDRAVDIDVTGKLEYGAEFTGSRTRPIASAPYVNCPNGDCTNTFNAAAVQCSFPPIDPKFFLEPGDAGYSATSDESFYNAALDGNPSNIIVGTYSVSGTTQELGYKVIQGNIDLGNSSTLTLTGPVWVTGSIISGNTTTVQMKSSSFAANQSSVLVARNVIGSGNQTSFIGLPTQKSFLLVASKNSNINVANNSNGAIFYAANGSVETGNCPNNETCAVINNVTANSIILGNNRIVQYDAALQDLILTGNITTIFSLSPNSLCEVGMPGC